MDPLNIHVGQYLSIALEELKVKASIEIENTLWNSFTYNNPDYQKALQLGEPTEDILPHLCSYFIDTKDNIACFPRGGLRKLKSALCDIPTELISSIYTASAPNQIEMEKLNHWQYRQYQDRVLKEILPLQHMKYVNGLIVSPAGSGKTIMGAGIINILKQPTLIIVPSFDILEQWEATLRDKFKVKQEIGRLCGGHNSIKDLRPITVAIINSLTQLIHSTQKEILKERFGMVILDEAHKSPAPTFTEAGTFFNPRYFFGFTATPYREDKKDFLMYDYCGETIMEVTDADLENEGVLIKPDVFFVPTEFYVVDSHPTFMRTALIKDEDRNKLIADHVEKDYREGHSVLVLSTRKAHCLTIQKLLQEKGIEALYIHGSIAKNKRKKGIESMRIGTEKVLVATNLADQGLDIERLSSLHLVTPTKNLTLIVQRIGRIKRVHESKLRAKIVDYYDERVRKWGNSYNFRRKFYIQQGFTLCTI